MAINHTDQYPFIINPATHNRTLRQYATLRVQQVEFLMALPDESNDHAAREILHSITLELELQQRMVEEALA